jgi:2-C-methyl-D-erythritol 4-phosphate cytidylyltransferase
MIAPTPAHVPTPEVTPDLGVILAGAGGGKRMGDQGPKLLIEVGGRPALARVAATFLAHAAVAELIAVVPPELEAQARRIINSLPDPRGVRIATIHGGATRQESVALGIEALATNPAFIAVHDVARVLVDASLIDRVLAAARATGAAIPALPIADTIKETGPGGDEILRSVPRERLAAAQTPQVFASAILRKAHAHARKAGDLATDEAGLAESIGVPVTIVAGDERNRKLTVPSDLAILNALLESGAAEGRS